jgi:hypothetical protein
VSVGWVCSGRVAPGGNDAALAAGRPYAPELGCEEELSRLPDIVTRGGGAGAQRSVFAIAGMASVIADLMRRTAA